MPIDQFVQTFRPIILGAQHLVGERRIALLDGQPGTGDAIAVTNCHLMVIERRHFLGFLHGEPKVAVMLIELLRGQANFGLTGLSWNVLPEGHQQILTWKRTSVRKLDRSRAHRWGPVCSGRNT
jgi:hypothetical protein